ncbi:MAG TPA: cupin domain-containing protein [Naasia sp.]|jgi:quercetin dioxygenase-like cupin family protein
MAFSGLTRESDAAVEPQEWGRLEWMVAGRLGNSERMTVGKCFIDPGQANPLHHHPNCDEVLHVLKGEIEHRVDDEVFRMSPGDTVSIPQGARHNARNLGADQAVLLISFSTSDRETIGE